MAIKITSTKNYGFDGVKSLVYSKAGYGKTWLCRTAINPFIVSSESGLMSLGDVDLPVFEIKTVDQIDEVLTFLKSSEESKKYDTICLDSISEIAEVMLIQYKSEEKDPRQAYGRMNDDMSSFIRKFRDLQGKHVYFTAKESIFTDKTNFSVYFPGMPGKTMVSALPFFFDEVFVLKLGVLEDGTIYRYLQTSPDLQYIAKDRSGALDAIEKPDLANICKKIKNM